MTINLPVRITRASSDGNGARIARNVSAGGMLVTPNVAGDRGERVTVVAGREREGVPAQIVGQRAEGTGLAFLAADEGRVLAEWMIERAHGGGI